MYRLPQIDPGWGALRCQEVSAKASVPCRQGRVGDFRKGAKSWHSGSK